MTSKDSLSCCLSKSIKEDPVWEGKHMNKLNRNHNPCNANGGYQREMWSCGWLWFLIPWGEKPSNLSSKMRNSKFFLVLVCNVSYSRKRGVPTEMLMSLHGPNHCQDRFCFHDLAKLGAQEDLQVTLLWCPQSSWLFSMVHLKDYFCEVMWVEGLNQTLPLPGKFQLF